MQFRFHRFHLMYPAGILPFTSETAVPLRFHCDSLPLGGVVVGYWQASDEWLDPNHSAKRYLLLLKWSSNDRETEWNRGFTNSALTYRYFGEVKPVKPKLHIIRDHRLLIIMDKRRKSFSPQKQKISK